MDNKREIKKQRPDFPSLLLNTDLIEFEKIKVYDLVQEFSETRKNRSFRIFLTVFSLILIFGSIVSGLTYYYQKRSEQIEVSIGAFEDIELREVLNQTKKLEDRLEQLNKQLDNLRKEDTNFQENVISDMEKQIKLINLKRISQSRKNQAIYAIRKESNSSIQKKSAEIQKQKEEILREKKDIEDKLAQYDSQKVAEAKSQEGVLDNQLQLYQIQTKKLKTDYEEKIKKLETEIDQLRKEEKKYRSLLTSQLNENHEDDISKLILKFNPKLEAGPVFDLIQASKQSETNYPEKLSFLEILQKEDEAFLALDNQFTQAEQQSKIVLDELQNIPYLNSIPELLNYLEYSLKRLNGIRNMIYQQQVQLVQAKNKNIEELNINIDKLNTELSLNQDKLTRQRNLYKAMLDKLRTHFLDPQKPAEGVLLSAENISAMPVLFFLGQSPSAQSRAEVIQGKKTVAIVSFYENQEGFILARLENYLSKREEGQNLQAFDKLRPLPAQEE